MNGSYFIRVASHVLLLQPQLGVLQLTTAVHRQPQQVSLKVNVKKLHDVEVRS